MKDVLKQLVEQVDRDVIGKNSAIPTALKTQTLRLITDKLLVRLIQEVETEEGILRIRGIFSGNPNEVRVNPLIGDLIKEVAPSLTQSFNIRPIVAQDVTERLIPAVFVRLLTQFTDGQEPLLSIESMLLYLKSNSGIEG